MYEIQYEIQAGTYEYSISTKHYFRPSNSFIIRFLITQILVIQTTSHISSRRLKRTHPLNMIEFEQTEIEGKQGEVK